MIGDILIEIFKHLPFNILEQIKLVNKQWYEVFHREILWQTKFNKEYEYEKLPHSWYVNYKRASELGQVKAYDDSFHDTVLCHDAWFCNYFYYITFNYDLYTSGKIAEHVTWVDSADLYQLYYLSNHDLYLYNGKSELLIKGPIDSVAHFRSELYYLKNRTILVYNIKTKKSNAIKHFTSIAKVVFLSGYGFFGLDHGKLIPLQTTNIDKKYFDNDIRNIMKDYIITKDQVICIPHAWQVNCANVKCIVNPSANIYWMMTYDKQVYEYNHKTQSLKLTDLTCKNLCQSSWIWKVLMII